MGKFIKKIIAVLVTVTSITGVVACSSIGEMQKEDKTKTNLYVYNYDGGIGTEWLNNAIERFEALYETESFESGKVGVNIEVMPGKTSTDDISGYDIVCTESVYFNDLINKGRVLDITDVVTSSLSSVKGSKDSATIESKLYPEQKSALTVKDGKYYVLPHYETYPGVSYDRDLFDREKLFFKNGYNSGFTNLAGDLSVGPDGVKNTSDDGLPSSYEEFYKLLAEMSKKNILPFIYATSLKPYSNNLLCGLWAAYSGRDEFMINVEFDGSTRVIEFDESDNPIEKVVEITPETGYLVSQQSGKYYALDFYETVRKGSNFYTKSATHIDAQAAYLKSDLINDPIAMIIEGSYWYNEAKGALKTLENQYPATGKNRNFAFMALPRQLTGQVTEGNGTKNALLDSLSSFMFISSDITKDAGKEKAAKTFLQFCYTDAELQKFTETTSTFKGVKYDIDDSILNGMSKYAQNLVQLRSESDIIHPLSNNTIFVNNQSKFNFGALSTYWASKINSTDYNYPIYAFEAGKTAKDYFKGLKQTSSNWSSFTK